MQNAKNETSSTVQQKMMEKAMEQMMKNDSNTFVPTKEMFNSSVTEQLNEQLTDKKVEDLDDDDLDDLITVADNNQINKPESSNETSSSNRPLNPMATMMEQAMKNPGMMNQLGMPQLSESDMKDMNKMMETMGPAINKIMSDPNMISKMMKGPQSMTPQELEEMRNAIGPVDLNPETLAAGQRLQSKFNKK
jgi:hypothetical protein